MLPVRDKQLGTRLAVRAMLGLSDTNTISVSGSFEWTFATNSLTFPPNSVTLARDENVGLAVF